MKQGTVLSSQCHLVSLQANSQCHSIKTASYRYFQFIVEVWLILTKNWKRNTKLIILLHFCLYKDKKYIKLSIFKFSFQRCQYFKYLIQTYDCMSDLLETVHINK